jgi:hypothetical protein
MKTKTSTNVRGLAVNHAKALTAETDDRLDRRNTQ